MTIEVFYAKRKLSYGDTVETHYYNPYVGENGGRIVTKGVCYVWYVDSNIVDKVEILMRPEVVGKNLLPLCRNFVMWILSSQLRYGVVIPSITDRIRNRVRRDSWRHLLIKESKRAENELEFVETVSYSVFWCISYTVFWGVSVKYNLYIMGRIMIYSIYNIIFINGRKIEWGFTIRQVSLKIEIWAQNEGGGGGSTILVIKSKSPNCKYLKKLTINVGYKLLIKTCRYIWNHLQICYQ